MKSIDYLTMNSKNGSIEHMKLLSNNAGFVELDDWISKSRNIKELSTFNSWLKRCWNNDLLLFLETVFPGQEIEWWKMKRVPVGTWKQNSRLKEYLDWLGLTLGYKTFEDWYHIKAIDFQNNYGGSIQTYYPSIIEALKVAYSEFNWLPWLFDITGNSYWSNIENRRNFLDYVYLQEQMNSHTDWSKLERSVVQKKYKGASVINKYDSFFDCIETLYPEHDFQFWFFSKTKNKWQDKENQIAYLTWLGKRLGFAKLSDWYQVTEEDFKQNYGSTLITGIYNGVANCITNILSEYSWEKVLFNKHSQMKMQKRLYGIVSCAFPNYDVEWEYKHPCLFQSDTNSYLRFDIFIPHISMAIEYNGKQHYEHVEIFHRTEEEFINAQNRNKLKRKACRDNDIKLIEIKYSDWDGSIEKIIEVFKHHIPSIELNANQIIQQASVNGLIEDYELPNSSVGSNKQSVPSLSHSEILNLADYWHEKFSEWPTSKSGNLSNKENVSWHDINLQLRREDNSSLSNFLYEKRNVIHHLVKQNLSIEKILTWAKHHYKETGKWPTYKSGTVLAELNENWGAIRSSLVGSNRGLPSGLSLEKLLHTHLGVTGIRAGKNLSEEFIIKLATLHHEKTGEYPIETSSWVFEENDSWGAISMALRSGLRGLKGGSSLALLLHVNGLKSHALIKKYPKRGEIIKLAEKYKLRTNKLPSKTSGLIHEKSDITWGAINSAIVKGNISDINSKSLSDLWVDVFDYRNVNDLSELSIKQVLIWCDEYFLKNNKYPNYSSTPLKIMGNETFRAVDTAIRYNRRGLIGYESLADLIYKERSVRTNHNLPDINLQMVQNWMLEWYKSEGNWPTSSDGEIPNSNGEKWSNINATLHRGGRGLPKTSLSKIKKKLIEKTI